jgi:hypothetical protein
MNTMFSRLRNDPYSNSYYLASSNQSNISWQAQVPKNYVPQFHELCHQAYPQFNDHIPLNIKQLHNSNLRLHHLLS